MIPSVSQTFNLVPDEAKIHQCATMCPSGAHSQLLVFVRGYSKVELKKNEIHLKKDRCMST